MARSTASAGPSYSIQQVGLDGGGYPSGAGATYATQAIQQLNAAGQVEGTTSRGSQGGQPLGQDAWSYTAATGTQLIGLTGNGYEYTSASIGGATYRNGAAQQMNAVGQVIGSTSRLGQVNGFRQGLGGDAWLYTPGVGTQVVGPTGAGYEYTLSAGNTVRGNVAKQIDDAGQVSGYAARYTATGGSLGADAWLFTPGAAVQVIGLAGPGYDYASTATAPTGGTGTGTDHFNSPSLMNAAGQVAGYALRYNAVGGYLGQDPWIYTGTGTQPIGLTGSEYEYASVANPTNNSGNGTGTYRFGVAQQINAAGQVLGGTTRYSSTGGVIGQDPWLYTAATGTQRIGLTGGEYEYVTSSGATYRNGGASQLNAAGQVDGSTARYNPAGVYLGSQAWVYAAGVGTRPIGLAGSDYEYPEPTRFGGGTKRNGVPVQMNAAGQVVGSTDRLNPYDANLGNDAWLDDGTGTRRIGLTGPGYEYTYGGFGGGTYRAGSCLQLNAAGQVIGTTSRYDAAGNTLGSAGWFYDDRTGATTPLQFSTSAAGMSTTTPAALTDAGVVLGSYELYAGSADLGLRAFEWSQSAGFADLGTLVAGGLTAAGWQQLTYVVAAAGPTEADGSPAYVVGGGVASSQSSQSIYLLTANPQAVTVVAGQTYHVAAVATAGPSSRQLAGLTVQAGGMAVVDAAAVQANRQLLLVAGTGVSLAGSAGAWTGTLDLGNNDLDLPVGDLATVTDQLRQGCANGTWAGPGGIVSASAAADATHLHALGVIENDQGGAPLFTAANPFDGTTPGAADVLVKYTVYGDANLDGVVDGQDYGRLDVGYAAAATAAPLTGWFNGDFNYDGKVDGSDYTLIDNAFNLQPAAAAASTTEVATVPEPAAAASLAALTLLRRRRPGRRRSRPSPAVPVRTRR